MTLIIMTLSIMKSNMVGYIITVKIAFSIILSDVKMNVVMQNDERHC